MFQQIWKAGGTNLQFAQNLWITQPAALWSGTAQYRDREPRAAIYMEMNQN